MTDQEAVLRGKMLVSERRIERLRASLAREQQRWAKLFAALARAQEAAEKAQNA